MVSVKGLDLPIPHGYIYENTMFYPMQLSISIHAR